MATSNQILEKYLSTLEKDPSSRVFAPLAEYYRKNGLLTQAIDTLSEGIKHNPEYVLGHLGLAFCHHDNGATKRAYDILRPLVDSNRDNIRMLKLFSDICLDLKKNQEALQYLKFLLFINPKDQETAEKVKELESNNSDFGPIKFNIEDDLSESGEQIQFNVDAISSTPEASSDMDEWIQVDFKSPEEKTLSTDGWSMEKDISLDQVENQDSENERIFTVNDNLVLKEGDQNNVYNLFKNGSKVGRIDLTSNSVTYSSFYESGEIKGLLSTPLLDSDDFSSRAIIKIKDESSKMETHQILEKKFTEIEESISIIRGNGVYQYIINQEKPKATFDK